MARVNICGFETGDTSETDGISGSTVSVQTTTVRTGTYALRCQDASNLAPSVAFRGIAADGTGSVAFNKATIFVRFYFNYATKPASSSEEIVYVEDTSHTAKFQCRIDSSGNLSAWNGTTQLGSTGTTVLVSGVWYCIEISVGTGVTSAWAIRIDGIPEISGTDTLGSAVNNGAVFIGKTLNRNSQAVDFFYDDVAIDDAAFPGPGSIVRLDPSADVAKTNWLNQAGSSTNLFQSVDDLASQVGHDTDSTYVVTSTSGTVTYTVSFPALSTRQIIGTINEIKFIAWGRDTATVLTWQISLRPASNVQTTTALDGGSTYAMRAILYKAKGGTDALTIANVNTCQASFIHVQNNARELRCTAMALMLDLPGVFSPPKTVLQAVNRASVY